MILLAAILLLQPVLADDGPVRMVATGVGDNDVTWTLDGVEVARTSEREAAVVQVAAGTHELRAASAATGRWQAVARPDGAAEGAAFVAAWSAIHEPADGPREHSARSLPPLWLTLGLVAALLLAWPSRKRSRPRAVERSEAGSSPA